MFPIIRKERELNDTGCRFAVLKLSNRRIPSLAVASASLRESRLAIASAHSSLLNHLPARDELGARAGAHQITDTACDVRRANGSPIAACPGLQL